MGDGGKDIGAVGSRAFDAISVVDTTLPRFVIDIEVLKIIVEVDGASAEVSAQECCMSCKDSGDIDVPLPAERNGDPGLPFVEVRNNCGMKLAREILKKGKNKKVSTNSGTLQEMGGHTSPRNQATT